MLSITRTFPGSQFYYADRNLRKPVKCTVLDVRMGFPCEIFAEKEETKETFRCFADFGCYELDDYDKALKDAQIQEDRLIY